MGERNPYPPPLEVTVAILAAEARAMRELTDERLRALAAELVLQAGEYERRLDALNHAHEKAIEVQHTYVTQEKYESTIQAEEQAREIALSRVDERFDEFVKRYELRQREIDQAALIQKAATDQIVLAAERTATLAKDAAAKSADEARERALSVERRANRNLVIVGLVITVIVGLANYLGSF